jgi:hypothetical protein
MLALAAVLLTAGSFGDRIGRKRVFVGAIAGLGVAQDPGRTARLRCAGRPAGAGRFPPIDDFAATARSRRQTSTRR